MVHFPKLDVAGSTPVSRSNKALQIFTLRMICQLPILSVTPEALGGQLKTGHTWALQKRPTELGQDKDIYSALGAVA